MTEPRKEPDIRVAIIEDRPRTREAIQALVDGTPGYHCTGSFGSAIYIYDSSTRQLRNTRLQPVGPYDDPANVAAEEVKVTARC
jgi:hypothetical protein